MKFFVIALALISTNVSATQFSPASPRSIELCAGEAIYGFPSVRKEDTTKICRKAYVLEYDNQAKILIWASYLLTPIETTGCNKRSNSFTIDISLRPNARSTAKDYSKSGYDMGHIVNAADMLWDYDAENESFLMSNMTPQLPEFNRGIWKKLEDSTRGWTLNRNHPLQIYAGTVYNREQDARIGRGVTVPHGFWKVIIDTETSEVMAFKFDNVGSKENLSTFITSLAEVQRATGLILPMPKKPVFATNKTWPRIIKSVGRHKTTICSLTVH